MGKPASRQSLAKPRKPQRAFRARSRMSLMNTAYQKKISARFMPEPSEFERLLRHAGAVSPRDGRGKWRCPCCGRWTLIVRPTCLDYRCQNRKCAFFGGINSFRNMFEIQEPERR